MLEIKVITPGYKERARTEKGQCFSVLLETDEVAFRQLVYRTIKRTFDLTSSLILLVVLSPLMAAISLMIYTYDKGPVIYRHRRAGKNAKPIDIFKFRTMVRNAEDMTSIFSEEQEKEWRDTCKVRNDPRVTKVGKILRKTSLDELPQLINIILGDMSVVGPRPITYEELERYGHSSELLLSVTPGLTGYWQAYARSDCSYEKRMQMELSYAENANVLWDIQILFATVIRVFSGKGAQ